MVYFLFLLMIQQLFFFKNVHIGNSYYFSNKFYFPFNFNIPFQFPLFIFFSRFPFLCFASFYSPPPTHTHTRPLSMTPSGFILTWHHLRVRKCSGESGYRGRIFFPFFPPLFNDNRFFLFSPPPKKNPSHSLTTEICGVRRKRHQPLHLLLLLLLSLYWCCGSGWVWPSSCPSL